MVAIGRDKNCQSVLKNYVSGSWTRGQWKTFPHGKKEIIIDEKSVCLTPRRRGNTTFLQRRTMVLLKIFPVTRVYLLQSKIERYHKISLENDLTSANMICYAGLAEAVY